jgi:hypothetical protein
VNARDLVQMGPRGWERVLADGFAVDPHALAGHAYKGTSLGLPPLATKLTWTTFRKAFLADDGAVRGWNVRVEQRHPHRPRIREGRAWTFGHYRVTPLRPGESPLPVAEGGVLLDYGLGDNGRLDPVGVVRDPVVAVKKGSVDLLLGWTYARVLGRSVGTPSWFVLEREGPLDHTADPPRGRAVRG